MPRTSICPHCGTQNAEDDLFCVNCGKKLSKPSTGIQTYNRGARNTSAGLIVFLIIVIVALAGVAIYLGSTDRDNSYDTGSNNSYQNQSNSYSSYQNQSSNYQSQPRVTATPRPSYVQTFNTAFLRKDVQSLPSGQLIAVYSGPSTSYYRGANGRAEVSTNAPISVWGYENGWYLISYSINAGGARFGYIEASRFKGSFNAEALRFAYTGAEVNRSVSLTDNPTGNQSITTLYPGAYVTYLATHDNWYYVEYSGNGMKVRGFIPLGSLDH